jgi:hypothetical protein
MSLWQPDSWREIAITLIHEFEYQVPGNSQFLPIGKGLQFT